MRGIALPHTLIKAQRESVETPELAGPWEYSFTQCKPQAIRAFICSVPQKPNGPIRCACRFLRSGRSVCFAHWRYSENVLEVALFSRGAVAYLLVSHGVPVMAILAGVLGLAIFMRRDLIRG